MAGQALGAQEIVQAGIEHVACVHAQHLGREEVEMMAVLQGRRHHHLREQGFIKAEPRAAGRGYGKWVWPYLTHCLHQYTKSASGYAAAQAAFQFWQSVPASAAA